ncbi:MAG: hypothetical protein O2954_02075 [bacterium]|nr:hypothetical protein [bacterium]
MEVEDAFVVQMRGFVEALRSGEEPPVPGSEVLKVMRALDLVKVASEESRVMDF